MIGGRKQILVLALLILTCAILAFLSFATGLYEQAGTSQGLVATLPSVAPWLLGLANAGIVVALYGLLGILGLYLASKAGLPGVFRAQAGWKRWIGLPMTIGLAVGGVISLLDLIFRLGWAGFEHPALPMSLIASVTAGIGEEIIYRGLVMALLATLLGSIMRGSTASLSIWLANAIAAIAFAAAHLPGVMMMLGVSSVSEIPRIAITELFVLNGMVGITAGERYMRDGLVAAIGVHFWADIVWHVIYPAIWA